MSGLPSLLEALIPKAPGAQPSHLRNQRRASRVLLLVPQWMCWEAYGFPWLCVRPTRDTYNSQPAAIRFEGDGLLIDLPSERLDREAPLQLRTIAFGPDTAVQGWQEGIELAPADLAVQAIVVASKSSEPR